MRRVALIACLLATPTGAELARAQAPATLAIRFVSGRSTFQPGERIEIGVAGPGGATLDLREGPAGWVGVTAVLDRQDGVATPLRPLDAGFDTRWRTGAPGGATLTLNGWYRFDAPGRYSVIVRARAEGGAELQSNALAFEVAARDPGWESAALARAVQTIDRPSASTLEQDVALADLRALATPASGAEIARRYRLNEDMDAHDEVMLKGLFAVRDRRAVIEALRAELVRPARRVDGWFVRAIALLELAERHPDGPPYGHDEYLGLLARDATERAQAIALGGGPGALEAELARELTSLGRYEDFYLAGALAPAMRNFPNETAAAFRTVDIEPQYNVLFWSWRRVASPAMAPVLRAIYQAPGDDWAKLRDLALRRYFELAPDQARPLMVHELQRDELRVSLTTLGRLPDASFPQMDQVWARRLTDGVLDERLDAAVRLERFGSAGILADVTRAYADQGRSWSCDVRAAVLGYLSRVDPATAAPLVRTALDDAIEGSRECRDALVRLQPAQSVMPTAAADAITGPWRIVVLGPVPGDERRIESRLNDERIDTMEALDARLRQLPPGTRVSWVYDEGTAATHLERWTLAEREAVFQRVRRAAAERGVVIGLAQPTGPAAR